MKWLNKKTGRKHLYQDWFWVSAWTRLDTVRLVVFYCLFPCGFTPCFAS